jgi:flagellar motor component MotA
LPAIAGIVIVLAASGGYVVRQGNPLLRIPPAERLIVMRAAPGITIVANPVRVIRKIAYGARNAPRSTTDQKLLEPTAPESPRHRKISIVARLTNGRAH